jgi:hypothetical protein
VREEENATELKGTLTILIVCISAVLEGGQSGRVVGGDFTQ